MTPDLFVLLKKVREVSVPKPERLETSTRIGMVVQKIGDHSQVGEQEAYLNNRTLLIDYQCLLCKNPQHKVTDHPPSVVLQLTSIFSRKTAAKTIDVIEVNRWP